MSVLIAIVASLSGVVVGAFLTRWIDAGYERRQEARQAIASALTLREELRDADAGIKVIMKDPPASNTFLFAGLEAWNDHREILLAVGMSHDDWVQLAHTFRQLLELTTYFKVAKIPELDEESLHYLEKVCRECREARGLLDPFIVDTDVPLLFSDSVFAVNRRRSRLRSLRWESWRQR